MPRPIRPHLKDLAERLKTVADSIGTRAEAARFARVSVAQLHNYLGARSEPAAGTLAALSIASGFCLDWIISGTGPERCGKPLPAGSPPPAHDQVWARLSRSGRALEKLGEPTAGFVDSLRPVAAQLKSALDSSGTLISADRVEVITQLYVLFTQELKLKGLGFDDDSDRARFDAKILDWLIDLGSRVSDAEWLGALRDANDEFLRAFDESKRISVELSGKPARLARALEARALFFSELSRCPGRLHFRESKKSAKRRRS